MRIAARNLWLRIYDIFTSSFSSGFYVFPLCFAALLAIAAAGLFAMQADERDNNGFHITRGPSFYIQVCNRNKHFD